MEHMENTVSFLRERITRTPHAIVILGSGLGGLADEIEDAVRIPYADIPGFPVSAVAGHAGALVAGRLAGVEVAAMQGRFHLYEGWEPTDVVRPIRTLAALGADAMVVTNAAGGIRSGMKPGDLMLIADHLNLTGKNPLAGRETVGAARFVDMSEPYDSAFRVVAREVAHAAGWDLIEGVYASLLGPSYETPAEVRMLAKLGADAVGMSTVPEVLVARALGLRVLGISCITNVAAGLGGGALSHHEVLQTGAAVRERFAELVRGVLPRIVEPNRPAEAAS